MKIKRKEWDALQARLKSLEEKTRHADQGVLMRLETGPVLMNVIVPLILQHLRVKAVHGYAGLLPIDPSPEQKT